MRQTFRTLDNISCYLNLDMLEILIKEHKTWKCVCWPVTHWDHQTVVSSLICFSRLSLQPPSASVCFGVFLPLIFSSAHEMYSMFSVVIDLPSLKPSMFPLLRVHRVSDHCLAAWWRSSQLVLMHFGKLADYFFSVWFGSWGDFSFLLPHYGISITLGRG